jgi:D-alanyl-D-alanine carboxypeptidase (penicillin-binding protein 5/6)
MFSNSNKRTLKKSLLIGASAATLFTALPAVGTITAEAQAPDVAADASITVDYDTGQILQGEAIDESLGIASMTKMLVEYIVHEEIDAGNLTWDTEITISDYAYGISQNYALSNVALRNGGTYSLEELYDAMAIYSANGATIAIAEHIEGSEPAFVDRMNTLVESFGITDASLVNSTGLNNSDLQGQIYPGSSETDENTMSARSAAIIVDRLLKDYPEILEVASIPEQTFRPDTIDRVEMTNWNWMLEGLAYERPGVDGLKTGTTNFAGTTFAGTATENDRRLITVVLNAGEDLGTRFVETDKMMDFGFNDWQQVNVTDQWNEVYDYEPLPVTNGEDDTVDYEPSESLDLLIQLTDSVEEDVNYTVEWNPDIVMEDGSIHAPFDEGMEIGRLVVDYAGNEHGFLADGQNNSVPLVTSSAVDQAGIFSRMWNWVADAFESIASRF